ncbi:putative malate dehydrogenase, active [Helianthus anomalus]
MLQVFVEYKYISFFLFFLSEFLHQAADITLVPSATIAKDLQQYKVAASNTIRLWNKGVDSDSFHPKFHSHEMRIRLSNGEPDRPLIVHVGFFKKVFKKAGTYDPKRLVGVTMLDVVRANTFVFWDLIHEKLVSWWLEEVCDVSEVAGRNMMSTTSTTTNLMGLKISVSLMVDADALLEKDLVTLDEALQIANNDVLMSLNVVSILTSISGVQQKISGYTAWEYERTWSQRPQKGIVFD